MYNNKATVQMTAGFPLNTIRYKLIPSLPKLNFHLEIKLRELKNKIYIQEYL